MSNDKVSQYAKEIPDEIKSTIKALDDDLRLAILVALMKHGKMTYTELKSTFGVNASSLSYGLSLLQDGGLVNNFLETGKAPHSYYDTTDITKFVLESLFDTIVSVPPPRNDSYRLISGEEHGKIIADNPAELTQYVNEERGIRAFVVKPQRGWREPVSLETRDTPDYGGSLFYAPQSRRLKALDYQDIVVLQ